MDRISKEELLKLLEYHGSQINVARFLNIHKNTVSKWCIYYDIKSKNIIIRDDMIGKRFGRLVVIERTENNYKGKTQYLCECNCGNKKITTGKNLRNGHTISCGCYNLKRVHQMGLNNFKDITGKRFGRLTAIKVVGKIKSNMLWLCQCECGNKTNVASSELLQGKTKSCGCLRKEILYDVHKKYNIYDLSGEYGIGLTSNTNEEFYFDLEDYDLIKDYCWNKHQDYLETLSNDKILRIHRLIMDAQKGYDVDHISHNTLDNRKQNLRIVTRSQNAMNQIKRINNTSGVTGVCWDNRVDMWVAYIGFEKELITLGYYIDFDEAVKIRKEAEEVYFKRHSFDNSMKAAQEYIIK
jgi:hypothetical protein